MFLSYCHLQGNRLESIASWGIICIAPVELHALCVDDAKWWRNPRRRMAALIAYNFLPSTTSHDAWKLTVLEAREWVTFFWDSGEKHQGCRWWIQVYGLDLPFGCDLRSKQYLGVDDLMLMSFACCRHIPVRGIDATGIVTCGNQRIVNRLIVKLGTWHPSIPLWIIHRPQTKSDIHSQPLWHHQKGVWWYLRSVHIERDELARRRTRG